MARITSLSTRRPRTDANPAPRNGEQPAIDYGPLPQLIGYVLRRTQLATFQDFMRAFAEVDIRPAQFAVLTIIERNPGLKQSQVSAALGIKRTNLVALLDGLEERRLATREPVVADRRSYALHLTEKGLALMQRLREINAAHEKRLMTHIGEEGRDRLLILLRGLLDAIGPTTVEDEES
jgi:DNA-binding MarR family transcriptional regulator